MLVFAVGIFMSFSFNVKAGEVSFTQEEKDFIGKERVLKAVSIDGAAPLHYRDSKGEIRGIAVDVLNEISNISGIDFEYYLYESVEEVLKSDFDVVVGVSKQYASGGIVLSKPYLETETVLFYSKALEPTELENRRFAAIKGGSLPEGIKEEQVIYYNDREHTLSAVENGKADYGYGNAYSVAFYMMQNGYKNVVFIPMGKEKREYCIGTNEEDKILLSIINKSIDAIDKSRMDMLVLDVASQIERKITFSMISDAYGKETFGLFFIIMSVLAYSVFSSTRAKNQFKMENKRYSTLSQLSNEYLFEYKIKTDELEIAEKLNEKVNTYENGEEIIRLLKDFIKEFDNNYDAVNCHTIKLPLCSEGTCVFRVLLSYLRDDSGKLCSIIGKLKDVSEEEREKEELIARSQLDGLTGLYNAVTTKEAILKSMSSKDINVQDALIIIDCDRFKKINDNYGHLTGNEVLKNISKGLKITFWQSDIIGRIGGDEFCVYMHDVPSVDFVTLKCRKFMKIIHELNEGLPVCVSVGISIFKEKITYEKLFQQADDALYAAKESGGAQVIIYDKKEDKKKEA